MSLELENPEWHAQAACRAMSLDDFFTERGRNVPKAARQACASCVVFDACYADAVSGGPDGMGEAFGFRAGTTPRQRQVIRGELTVRAKRARTPGGCGTPTGYKWHSRRGEPSCEECLDARRAYRRMLAAERRAA